MAKAILTINSKNYSSRALRAWLLCKMAGLSSLRYSPMASVSHTHDALVCKAWNQERRRQ